MPNDFKSIHYIAKLEYSFSIFAFFCSKNVSGCAIYGNCDVSKKVYPMKFTPPGVNLSFWSKYTPKTPYLLLRVKVECILLLP